MAVSAGTIWECRFTGAANNGAGFDPTFGGVDASQSNSGTTRTDIALGYVAAPAAPIVTDNVGGGSLSAGTYGTKVTYYNANAATETDPSAAASTAGVALNDSLTVTSPAASEGATHYKVYMTVAGGATYFLVNGAGGTALGSNYTQTTNPSNLQPQPPASSLAFYTSAATPYTANDKGNVQKTTAGVNFTLGYFQIKDFTATSSRAYMDRAAGTNGSTAGTGTLGGASSTPQVIIGTSAQPAVMVAGNTLWIKYNASVYGQSVKATFGLNASAGTFTLIQGYDVVRGDHTGNKPTLQMQAANQQQIVEGNTSTGLIVENIIIDGNSETNTAGLDGVNVVRNCLVKNCTNYGISQPVKVEYCEITGCTDGGNVAHACALRIAGAGFIRGCNIHGNTVQGIYTTGICQIEHTVIAGSSGANQDGIYADGAAGTGKLILSNVDLYNNARDGLHIAGITAGYVVWATNCISSGNGGYGFFANSQVSDSEFISCYGFNNTSGTANTANMTYPFNSFTTLTADPYVSAGTGNFAENFTAGGGLVTIGGGDLGTFPSGLSQGYLDGGAVQSKGGPAGAGQVAYAFLG